MSETKTYVFGENGNSQNNGFDPNLLWGMMLGGGGFGGGFGAGGWLWPLFLLALWGGNGFGFGGWGNNGGNGCCNNLGFLSDQLNNNAGRELLMQAINGNRDAIGQLATSIGCKTGDIQNALQSLSSQICQFSGQVGLGQQQIINALQAGDANLAHELFKCCCDLKGAIAQTNVGLERGFSSVAYETQRQTCDIEKAISGSTLAITARLDAIEKTSLLDKIDKLREEKSTLTTQLNLEHQNQYTAGVVAQAIAPVNAALGDLSKRLADIECNQPPVAKIPYVPAAGNYIPVNYSVPVSVGYGCGYSGYSNNCGC